MEPGQGTCILCGKPLAGKQEEFCSESHRTEFHGIARQLGDAVLRKAIEIIEKRREYERAK